MTLPNLSSVEKKVVHCRYVEGLTNRETAEKLNLGFWNVKYRIRKPTVQAYIRRYVIPKIVKRTLRDIDQKLSDPFKAFIACLKNETEAKTFIWGQKRRNWYDHNSRQMKALRRISSIFGLFHYKQNHNRDIRRWMNRMVLELKQKRNRIQAAYKAGILDARAYQ